MSAVLFAIELVKLLAAILAILTAAAALAAVAIGSVCDLLGMKRDDF